MILDSLSRADSLATRIAFSAVSDEEPTEYENVRVDYSRDLYRITGESYAGETYFDLKSGWECRLVDVGSMGGSAVTTRKWQLLEFAELNVALTESVLAVMLSPVFAGASDVLVIGEQEIGAKRYLELQYDLPSSAVLGGGPWVVKLLVDTSTFLPRRWVGRSAERIEQIDFIEWDVPLALEMPCELEEDPGARPSVETETTPTATPTPTVVELPATPEPDVAAETPELLWRYETGGVVNSSPAVVDDLVYVSSEDGYVYGLDALTGRALWGTDIGEQRLSSPTVAEGVVYFSFAEGYVVALDALTGEVQWGSEAGDKGLSPPALANGVVYVGSNDRYVYALDANSGQSVWHQQTGQVWASPVVVGGVIYIGSVDDHIYALDVANGELLWRYEAGGMIMSSPAVVDGVVYVGSADHHIYAVDAADGGLLWRHPTGGQVWSSPAVEDGMVYVGSIDEHLYALDANTGQLVWQYWAGDAVYSSPAVEDGVVYVGSSDGHVHALDAKTGQLVWRYKTGGQIWSSPAVAEGVVYIGSDDGYVYALTLQGFREKSREGSGGPYSWSTESVEFAAESFVITIGDREFQPVLSTLEIDGWGGDEESSTLELTWFDNGVEMRVNVYFEADAMTWWSDEVRTYDGQLDGDWVYHYHERLFDQPLGSAFQGDIILQGVTRSGEIAKLAISGARVKAFSYYKEGAGLEDSLVGLLMALGNTLGRYYGQGWPETGAWGNLDAIDVADIHEEDISEAWACGGREPIERFLTGNAQWPIHEAPQSFMDEIGRIPTWEVEVSDGTGRVVSTLGPGFEIFQGSFVLEGNYWRLVPDFIEGCSRR